MTTDEAFMNETYNNAIDLKIVGIVCPEGSNSSNKYCCVDANDSEDREYHTFLNCKTKPYLFSVLHSIF